MAFSLLQSVERLVEQFDRLAAALQPRQPPQPERLDLDQHMLALRRQAAQPQQESLQGRAVATKRRGEEFLNQRFRHGDVTRRAQRDFLHRSDQ